MDKEDWSDIRDEGINEALDRFRRSLIVGRKSYFDVSEFESIVDILLDEGDLNTSEIAALQGMQIHPGAVPLQLKYAQVLLSKGKYKNALKYLNLAEQVELTNPDIHLMKGSAWLVMGNKKEAEKSFNKALKYAGDEKDDILYHIGSSYVQAGDTRKAINYFEKSLRINPENEFALYDLGFYSDQEGQYNKSIEYYNRYLDIDPFNFSIWFNLAISYNRAKQHEKCIEAYEFALALNEDFDQALFNVANAYANAGKFNESIERYLTYLEKYPDNDDAYCYIGECYLSLDDHPSAEYYYIRSLELNPENDNALFGFGMILWVRKNYKESIRYVRKAIKLDPINADYYVAIAKVYNDTGQVLKAEKALNKAIDLDPANVELYITWADVCIKHRTADEAIRWLRSGLECTDSALLKYYLTSLLLAANQEKEAYRLLAATMAQDFKNISILFEKNPGLKQDTKLIKFVEKFKKKHKH